MVDAVVGVLVENLNLLIHREFGLLLGVKNDMEKLSNILSTVRDVLEDAELKQIKQKAIANWLEKLQDAAYDACDVLDDWSLKAKQQQVEETDPRINCCRNHGSGNVFSCLKHAMFRRKLGKQIKDIISKFDEIAAERHKFHLSPGVVQTGFQYDGNRETSSTATEPLVYGRDEDRENIIDIVVSNKGSPDDDVSVCPIIGIGGLGKTTLAQLVYNDVRVVSSFEVRIWVCVSDPFDLKQVLKAMIESFDKKACDLVTLEVIKSKVAEMLRGKRYLIVLDDLWNKNLDEWNRLKGFLSGGANGSSIIITTRLEVVASMTCTVPTYRLGALSDDDCWSLFKHRAFGLASEMHPNLVGIGKEIVRRCKGVPLAAKSLGSLLWMKTEVSQWKLVRDSEIWRLKDGDENDILPALRLSYNHLPPRLRQCFSFCSIFPKDHKMKKDELIHLWIANGFIQYDGRMEVEEIGNEIFRELLWRSFFQDIEADRYGNIETCKMHDLLHDLASSIAVTGCAIGNFGETKDVSKRVRHVSLSVQYSQSPMLQPFLNSHTSLHTLLFLRPLPKDLFLKLKLTPLRHLRALNLSGNSGRTLSPSVGSLKHLRYLNLSDNDMTSLPESLLALTNLEMLDLSGNFEMTTLPESICALRNLQWLILSRCYQLQALPEAKNMRSIRHLDLEGCSGIRNMPVGIGNLTCLQTLNLFVVGSRSGCGVLNELQELNELKGLLEIEGLEHVKSSEDAKHANLRSKQHLDRLKLTWWSGLSDDSLQQKNSKEVLEGLQLPLNVKELTIYGYRWATYFPDRLFLNLNALQSFEIRRCDNLESLPVELENLVTLSSMEIRDCKKLVSLPDGLYKLTNLKHLHISGCYSMKYLPVLGIRGLKTSLLDLSIWSCDNLRSLSEGLQYLTSLEKLYISKCRELVIAEDFQYLSSLRHLELYELPKLTALPYGLQHLTALQSLNIKGCNPNLQIFLERYLHTGLEEEKGDKFQNIIHIPRIELSQEL